MVQQTKWNQCVLEKGLFFIFACIIHDDVGQTTMLLLCLLLFDRYTKTFAARHLSIYNHQCVHCKCRSLMPRSRVLSQSYICVQRIYECHKDTMINDAYPHIDIIALFGRNLFYGFVCAVERCFGRPISLWMICKQMKWTLYEKVINLSFSYSGRGWIKYWQFFYGVWLVWVNHDWVTIMYERTRIDALTKPDERSNSICNIGKICCYCLLFNKVIYEAKLLTIWI